MQKNLISLPAFKNPKVPNIDQHFGPIDWTWEAATSPSGEASCVTCLAPALPGRPPAVEAGCPCCSWAGLCGRFSEGQVLLPTSQTYPSVPPYLEFVLPFSTLKVLQGLRLFCVRFPLASLLLLHACRNSLCVFPAPFQLTSPGKPSPGASAMGFLHSPHALLWHVVSKFLYIHACMYNLFFFLNFKFHVSRLISFGTI